MNKDTLEWKCIYVFILSLCRIINLNLHLNIICTPTYAAFLRQELYYGGLEESCFHLFISTPSKLWISRQQHTDALNVTCSHLLISLCQGPFFNERTANGKQVCTTEYQKSNRRMCIEGDHRHLNWSLEMPQVAKRQSELLRREGMSSPEKYWTYKDRWDVWESPRMTQNTILMHVSKCAGWVWGLCRLSLHWLQ